MDKNKSDVDDRVRELIRSAKTMKFEPKEVIYNDGDAAHNLYFVRSGLVKLVTYLPNGKARIVRLCHIHSIMGIEGLADRRYGYSAVSMLPCEVSCISLRALDNLKRENTELYAEFLEKFLCELNSVGRWYAEISTGAIRARVARLLQYLSLIERKSMGNRVCLLTCEDISSVLGATVESVSRVMAEFKRNGFLTHVEGSPRGLYECDMVALSVVAMDDRVAYGELENARESRHYLRKPVDIDVMVYQSGELVKVASIKNLSEQGVFVCLDEPNSIEREANIEIELLQNTSSTQKRQLCGRVVHRTRNGVGVMIDKFD